MPPACASSRSASTSRRATPAEITDVRRAYGLPPRFVLFVGTLEPRKNLARLAAAMKRLDTPTPLVVAGPTGWGDVATGVDGRRPLPRVRPGGAQAGAVRRR